MATISVQDLKARLSSAVAEAEAGATLVITRHNEPVARLMPVAAMHTHRGARVGSGKLRPAIKGGLRGPGGCFWRRCSTTEATGESSQGAAFDIEVFELRDLTLDLCAALTMPAVATPRSLDLAHLQSALWFHAAEPIDAFVTMDRALAQAARELGLPA